MNRSGQLVRLAITCSTSSSQTAKGRKGRSSPVFRSSGLLSPEELWTWWGYSTKNSAWDFARIWTGLSEHEKRGLNYC